MLLDIFWYSCSLSPSICAPNESIYSFVLFQCRSNLPENAAAHKAPPAFPHSHTFQVLSCIHSGGGAYFKLPSLVCIKAQTLNISITADLWQNLDTEGNTARCISAAGFMSGLGDNSGRGFISQGFSCDEIQRHHGISESLILHLHITL